MSCPDPGYVAGSLRYDYTATDSGSTLLEQDEQTTTLAHDNYTSTTTSTEEPSSPLPALFHHGDNVTYVCQNGYSVQGGDLSRSCDAHGNWTGSSPTCIRDVAGVDTRTVLISAACIILGIIIMLLFLRIHFYFYQKRKARARRYRTRGRVQEGQKRPTSYIIRPPGQQGNGSSGQALVMMNVYHHLGLDVNAKNLQQLSPGDGAATDMQASLNQDINRILGNPERGYNGYNNHRTPTHSLKNKSDSRSHVKSSSKINGGLQRAHVSVQTDMSLLESMIGDLYRTHSLTPTTKRRKKKRRIRPLAGPPPAHADHDERGSANPDSDLTEQENNNTMATRSHQGRGQPVSVEIYEQDDSPPSSPLSRSLPPSSRADPWERGNQSHRTHVTNFTVSNSVTDQSASSTAGQTDATTVDMGVDETTDL